MKKLISALSITTLLISLFFAVASANDGITIYVNEQVLQCEIAPYIENGRTMVPMRKIFEALDATVGWEDATKTITATKDDTVITLQINNQVMYKNGVVEYLDVVPVIVDSSTFVPLRAVSQSLNASVEWLGDRKTVYINSPQAYAIESIPTEAKITMYAADGRTIDVPESEIDSYKNVGWYLEPVTLMYALDGRTIYVPNSEVEMHKNVGWYLTPVVKVYAADGRSLIVPKNELSDYLNVGWYRTFEEAKASALPQTPSYNTGSSNNVSSPNYNNHPNSGGSKIYRTPTGTKYHFDPDCGGKNSTETTLEQAKNAGLTPCSKCAN